MSLSIGGIISQTFSMTRQRIGSLLGIYAIYFVLQLVLMFVMFGAVGSSFMMAGAMESPMAMGAGAMLMMIVAYIAYFLIYMAQGASLVHNASPVHDTTLGDSFMEGLRKIPTLFGLALLLMAAYIAAVLLLAIVGAIFSLAGDAGSVLFLVAVFLGMIYVACRLSLIMPVIAVDGVRNPITAVTRSWTLTSGHVGKIFVVILLFSLIVVGAILAMFALMGGSMMGFAAGGNIDAAAPAMGATMIVFFLGFLVLMVLLALLSAAFMAVLHASLAGPEAVAETFA